MKISFRVSQGASGEASRPVRVQTWASAIPWGRVGKWSFSSFRTKRMISFQMGEAPVTPEAT